MKTVARPATVDPGIFAAATAASAAASYWIGPSTSSSGARSRTSAGRDAHLLDLGARARLARRVRQHRDARLDAELAAVAADETAMSASCSDVGSGMTAQSP